MHHRVCSPSWPITNTSSRHPGSSRSSGGHPLAARPSGRRLKRGSASRSSGHWSDGAVVGRIFKALEETNQLDNTLIVFASDNGYLWNEHHLGDKRVAYEESIRIPLLMRYPKIIKAGTKINISFHVHSVGTQTPTNVALGLKLYPKGYVPKHVVVSAQVRYPEIDIRPNTANVRLDGYLILPKAARLLSYQPHMHDRGKSACIEAIYPTKTGVLNAQMLNCARFFFNWHLNYVYRDDTAPLLPAGTVLHTLQWYDNTAANKFNPDPDAQITYGQRTIDEMAGAWLSYYLMSDDEYKREVEQRRAPPTVISSR